MMSRRPSGFSVLGTLVALGLSALVFSALMSILLTTVRMQRRAYEEARMLQSSEIALLTLQRDLSFAGTGLPLHWPVNPVVVTAGGGRSSRGVQILGDQPAPDALYPTLGMLVPRTDGRRDLLMWRTPHQPGGDACRGSLCPSAFFSSGDGCRQTGSGDNEGGSIHCPWAGGRAFPLSTLHVINARGQLGHAVVDGPQLRAECPPQSGCGLQLREPVRVSGEQLFDFDDALAWVTTPDRIRWWLGESGVVYRQQCQVTLHAPDSMQVTTCSPREEILRDVWRWEMHLNERVLTVEIVLRTETRVGVVEVTAVGGGRYAGWQS